MAYTFKSRSAASVTMLRANGDDILRLIGRTPAERGALAPEDLPAAIAALEAAIVVREPAPRMDAPAPADDDDDDAGAAVPLRQRALPFLELLVQARAAGEPVTWGVV
ncbi:MAG: DUF1840 family protein [bacterium]|jgi:hypothetical protein|nr:DUF1840 domain-containing protein [Betaproteobacteria bacterium]